MNQNVNQPEETFRQKVKRILLLKNKWYRRLALVIWMGVGGLLLGAPAYILSVRSNLFGWFGEMPDFKAIENPQNDLSSELISADGVSLARYFLFNRSQITYDELSPDLINTLLISEDHRFRGHSGLDFPSYLRVLYGVITFNVSAKGGGSTITQQLAKNLYTINPQMDGSIARWGKLPRRIMQKTKEWIISIDLERNFTKEEIIALYLNTCEFGSNAYGIKIASETYFGKQPSNLNIQEAAVLVGMLQNSSLFNPRRNPKNALSKRNQVLTKLFSHGWIKTRKAYDSIRSLPIALNYSVQNQNDGLAPYFRTAIENDLKKWCKEHGYNLLSSGLKIYTTIDSRMQRYAVEAVTESMREQQKVFDKHWKGRDPWTSDGGTESDGFLESRIKQTDVYRTLVARYGAGNDSVNLLLKLKRPMTVFTWDGERDTLFSHMDSLRYYKRFLQTGFVSIDPQTGEIKAWVGGIDYKYFKFDNVRQALHQPGSTFKPFVYGAAMEVGFHPCFKLQDISPTITLSGSPSKTWTPANAEGDYGTGDWLTLRQAMAKSKNSITAQVLQRVGVENIISFARRAGISSRLDAVPTLSLGVSNVSLHEIVGSYTTFVNLGAYTVPYYITRIEDKNGNVIENRVPKTRQAISEHTAFKMVHMFMGGVDEEGGTSRAISRQLKEDNEIGGKTGTTSDGADGWYIGITHDLVSGAWVGGDERRIRFRQWSLGTGGRTALPIWDRFMLKVYADPYLKYKKGQFKRPSTQLDISLDCQQYTPPGESAKSLDNWNPNN